MRAFIIVVFYLFMFLSFKVVKDPSFDYIKNYAGVAAREMERSGIPVSIKLAQALLESETGKSPLALQANNHFGIKCGKEWTGKTYYKIDDDSDADGNTIESCFRAFDSAEESFKAHSDFLKDPRKSKRYGFLFTLDKSDYKSWAVGLRNAGYATDPTYPDKLIRIIEKYELYKYDLISGATNTTSEILVKSDVPKNDETQKSKPSRIKLKNDKLEKSIVALKKIKINNTEAVAITSNSSVENISKALNLKVAALLAFNEFLYSPEQIVFEGTNIFTKRKNKDYDGKMLTHKVLKSETLESIANIYGVRVNTLYSLNRIPKGNQPLEGEFISLKEKVEKKSAPKYKKETNTGKLLFSLAHG
jgi:LysM repeat protein